MLNNLINRIVLMIVAISCNTNKQDTSLSSEYPIIIDINEALRNKIDYMLSDIIDSISYLPVESIIDDYVTSIDPNNLKIGNKYILTADYFSKDLLLYNINGKFIRKLAQKGQGPGEYIFLDDLAIDEQNEMVYVLCRNKRKIFKYSLEGSFLGEIILKHHADRIVISPSGRLLIHFLNTGDLHDSFLLLDHKGDTITKHLNGIFYPRIIESNPPYYNDNAFYYIYNDKIHIKDRRDTLFIVENDKFLPKYVFHTGENLSNNMTELEFDNKIRFRYIFETDGKVLFEFRLKEKWHRGYYDKKQSKSFTSREVAIINDMDDTNKGIFRIEKSDIRSFGFIYSDYQFNDVIIIRRNSEFDMDVLKQRVSASKFLEINTMLDSLLLEDDDPVILSFLHLKK